MAPTVWIAGGAALYLLGLALATEGMQIVGGRGLRRGVERVDGRERAAFVLGLTTAAAPASRLHPSTVIALAASGLLRLGPALAAALGAGFALVATGIVATIAATSPEVAGPAASIGACGAVFAWCAPSSRAGFVGRVVAGWALVLISGRVLAVGLGAGAFQLDAIDLGTSARAVLFVALGAGTAGLLGSAGAVVFLVMSAVCASALELSSGAALLIGAHVGTGLSAIPAVRTERGDGKRAAVGILIQTAAHAPLGLLLVRVLLPMLNDRPDWLASPAVALLVFQAALWGLGALVLAPLVRPLRELLESQLVAEKGEGGASLVIPELAVAGIEQRGQRLVGLTSHMARHVLGGARISDFRVESDRGEAELLVRETATVHARLAPRSLPTDLAYIAGGCVRRARRHIEILDALTELRQVSLAGEQGAAGPLEGRVRQHELVLLHFLEGCLGPFSIEGLEGIQGEHRTVEARHADLDRQVLGGATQGWLDATQVAFTLRRLALLERIGRVARDLAAIEADREHVRSTSWIGRIIATVTRSTPETVEEPVRSAA